MATTNSIDPIPSVILQGHYQFNEFFGVSTPSNITVASTAGTLNLNSTGNLSLNASGAGNGINLNANIFTNFNAPLVQFTNGTGTLYSAVGVINMTAQNNSSIVSLGGDFVFGANGVLTFNSPTFTLPQLANATTANAMYYDTVSKHVSYGPVGGGSGWNLTGTNTGTLVFGTSTAVGWTYQANSVTFASVDALGATTYNGEFTVTGEFNVNTTPGIEMITGAQFILTATNDITLDTALGDINLASPNVKLPTIPNTSTANVLFYNTLDGSVSYAAAPGGGSAWNLIGNASTNPATNYVGTSDAQNLSIRVNAVEKILVEPNNITFSVANITAPSLASATTTHILYYNTVDGVISRGLLPAASNWSLSGNAATNPSFDYIGTSDLQNLSIRVNATQKMLIEPAKITFSVADLTAPTLASATTANTLYYNTSTGQITQGLAPGGGSGWALTGNAATNPGTNYVGTSDAQDFSIRRNAVEKILVAQSVIQISESITLTKVGGSSISAVDDLTLSSLFGGSIFMSSTAMTFSLPNNGSTFTLGGADANLTINLGDITTGGNFSVTAASVVELSSGTTTTLDAVNDFVITSTAGDTIISAATGEISLNSPVVKMQTIPLVATAQILFYDSTSKEITYGAAPVGTLNPGTANTLTKYNGAGNNIENSILTQPAVTRVESAGLFRLLNFSGDYTDKAEGGIYYDTDFDLLKYYQAATVRRTVVHADGALASSSGQFAVFDGGSWSLTSSPSMVDFGAVVRFEVPLVFDNNSTNPGLTTFGATYYNSTVNKLRYYQGGGGGWTELPIAATGTNSGLQMPGITTAARNALSPAAGWIIYNTTDNKHQGYDGAIWNDLY